ncbi:MAG TPA: pyridoxal-phosphate dependent enzyme [Solirubrobacterales bacterium]|nr:pyridoxal-phosphate dependent enzyme [Solirubrobacterales bacterium]
MTLEVDLDRITFGGGPTPVRELSRLGAERGRAPLWIKDDGAYSELGGNKARKLEWLLAPAVRGGKRTILTGGAIGTNHGLTTALCARRLGMRAVLILVPQPASEHVRGQLARLRESGAELHFAAGLAHAWLLGARLIAARTSPTLQLPHLVLPGGSVPLGCVGYVEAAFELRDQVASGELPEPSHLVVPLGSGGTAAGLVAGLKLAGLRSKVVCVLVSDVVRVGERTVAWLARRTIRLLGRHGMPVARAGVSAGEIAIERRWLGAGYGHPTPQSERAMRLFAERESVLLEPVYTAKAAAALLELNRRGAFGAGPVLYWHTYGAPVASGARSG